MRAGGWGLGGFGSGSGSDPSIQRPHGLMPPQRDLNGRDGPRAISWEEAPRWSAVGAELCSCPLRGYPVTPRYSPFQPKPVEVQVITHHMQRYAVWFGGSMLASTVSSCLDCSVFSCLRSSLSLNEVVL